MAFPEQDTPDPRQAGSRAGKRSERVLLCPRSVSVPLQEDLVAGHGFESFRVSRVASLAVRERAEENKGPACH